ncbi:hypothetical protein CC86DRAFT_381660 [Ophiobolus disseminans]|uniref:Polynucleotide 5'-hydroxyl-kinase GRC3 n=1 Tax=Ophiobolus disseminans TaxID=1469910 RepID=A0A6A7A2X8_9PLEO|nr:hypothetical protein CC86DRAFT_381660 [Ophiobolus disseminans]
MPEPEYLESDEEPLAIQQNLKLCNWRSNKQDILSDTDTELTVRLNKHTTIALIGSFQFKVLRGAVNVNGANIEVLSRDGQKDHVHTAYVPATHPISKIRGLDSVNQVQFITCKEPVPLASISPVFSDIWSSRLETNGRSFSVITESGDDALARPLRPETTSEDWLRVIEECASDPSVIIVLGPSTSGKSTFARRLLNRHLTGQGKSSRPVPAVCYLSLDPIKPEYTPLGQISLTVVRSLNLGPAFTHPAAYMGSSGSDCVQTVRSHAVSANFVNHQDHYRACAEDLFLAYKNLRARDPLLPLIINMSSYLYGTDVAFLTELLTRFKPHHAVHLEDTQAINIEQAAKLHAIQTAISQYRGTIHEITAHVPASVPMRTNAELRAMHMQSYFHLRKISTGDDSTLAWTPDPLSSMVPWEFCFEETFERMQDFVGFAMYSEPVEPASLAHALNGSIVQIVESTSSAIPTPFTSLPRTNKYHIPYFEKADRTGLVEPLDPKTSKIVCTALIRGFDPEKRVVQIFVPKTHEALLYNLVPERTVFVGGCCESPEWAYLEDAYAGSATATGMNDGDRRPWVEGMGDMDDMGYLNTVRRVRKFQT